MIRLIRLSHNKYDDVMYVFYLFESVVCEFDSSIFKMVNENEKKWYCAKRKYSQSTHSQKK